MKKNVWKLLAAILSIAVILSLSTITVFAEAAPTDTETASVSGDEDGAPAEDTASADTTENTEVANDDDHDHDHETGSTKRSTYWLPTLIVLAVIIIGCAVWVFTDRERAVKLWRSFKSEFKKIVWADLHQTTKNTILVVIAIVVFAAVIGVIDYLFSAGIVTLGKII